MTDSKAYDKALDVISKRRYNAKIINEQHFKEVESKIPEILEINRQLANTSLEILSLIKNNKNVQAELDKMKKRNLEAQELVRNLLIYNGYSEDYLDVKYTCPICFDTGFVDGKRCDCFSSLISRFAVDELNSHSQMKLCSFSTFNLDYYKNIPNNSNCYENMANVFSYCKNYANTFSHDSKNIFMLGNTGLGKTHLSLSIAETVISRGFDVLYDSAQNYLRQIEKEHFGKDDAGKDTLGLLLDADLLILDDLGSEYETSFYVSTVYNLINTRLNKGLPTIISTNLTPKQIEKRYEARIVSRLFAMYDYLKFEGNDIRIKKK